MPLRAAALALLYASLLWADSLRVTAQAANLRPGLDTQTPVLPTPGATSAEGVVIEHEAIGCVIAGSFPRLEAHLEPAARVVQARLMFRTAGGPDWYWVEMKREGSGFAGVLPKPQRSLKRFTYYIEATDAAFGLSRTAEHEPEVVAGPGACSKRIAAVATGVLSLIVGSAVRAPTVPAGFSAANVVAAGAATAAGAAGTSGGAGAGSAGLAGKAVALVAGGAAVVGGVALAASGRGEARSGSFVLSNARWNPTQFSCPLTGPNGINFTNTVQADGVNGTAQDVTILAASRVDTVVASNGGIPVGRVFQNPTLVISPAIMARGSSATIQFASLPGVCINLGGGTGSYSDFSAVLTVSTSAGTFTLTSSNSFRLQLE